MILMPSVGSLFSRSQKLKEKLISNGIISVFN